MWTADFGGHWLPGLAVVLASDEFKAKDLIVKRAKEHGLNLMAGDIELESVPMVEGVALLDDGDM